MEYLILAGIGMLMGVFGGLLGIGGSIIMIPALVFVFGVGAGGQRQHLYQASAMICNFFVAAAATLAHKKAKMLMGEVIRLLVPSGLIGIVLGVLLSNSRFFSGPQSIILTRIFGFFIIYVVVYNVVRLFKTRKGRGSLELSDVRCSGPLTILTGLITGVTAGLLGLGGGSVCVPMQQVLLKMPLRRAISNSAATIILMAVTGAVIKNATLTLHGLSVGESVRTAAAIIPTAIVGGFVGGRMVHIIPKTIVRTVFILLMLVVCYRMLTATPAG